jgi:hypothetical protein
VYVGSQTSDLVAIDLQTGKLRWKYHAKDGIWESSPAVHDGIVYVGDLSGLLHAVTAEDGKALIKSSPVVAGDKVLPALPAGFRYVRVGENMSPGIRLFHYAGALNMLGHGCATESACMTIPRVSGIPGCARSAGGPWRSRGHFSGKPPNVH